MREFLFRGKRIDNGEWIEGGGIYIEGERCFILVTERYIPDTRDPDVANYYEENPVYKPTRVEVVPETVGQFIGAYDKNGNKIFEGDVLVRRYIYEKDSWVEIEYYEASFCCKFDDHCLYPVNTCAIWNYEIFGNIYDNPELKKGE